MNFAEQSTFYILNNNKNNWQHLQANKQQKRILPCSNKQINKERWRESVCGGLKSERVKELPVNER